MTTGRVSLNCFLSGLLQAPLGSLLTLKTLLLALSTASAFHNPDFVPGKMFNLHSKVSGIIPLRRSARVQVKMEEETRGKASRALNFSLDVEGNMEGSRKDEELSQGIIRLKSSPVKGKLKTSPEGLVGTASPSRKRKRKSSQNSETILFSSDIAKLSRENQWIDLNIPPEELRPSCTLTNGQCFNWHVVYRNDLNKMSDISTPSPSKVSAWGTSHETEWIGPIQDWVLSIREMPTTTLARVLVSPEIIRQDTEEMELKKLLFEYFQLSTPLEPLYAQWGRHDPRLAKIAPVLPGVRVLRQNPVECLFSFICSSNNNIPRITKMLASFRSTFGRRLLDVPVRILKEKFIEDGNTESQIISSSIDLLISYSC